MEEKYIDLVASVADIIQIGSRNMQNYPFLTKIAKVGKPILLKRHYGASLRDWLGAAEYILYEGNKNLILCERGMSIHIHIGKPQDFLWTFKSYLQQRVCHYNSFDPSHATFLRPWVAPMTTASIGAGADGIMLEIRRSKNAAVDPLQPISFKEFSNLMQISRRVASAIGRKIK